MALHTFPRIISVLQRTSPDPLNFETLLRSRFAPTPKKTQANLSISLFHHISPVKRRASPSCSSHPIPSHPIPIHTTPACIHRCSNIAIAHTSLSTTRRTLRIPTLVSPTRNSPLRAPDSLCLDVAKRSKICKCTFPCSPPLSTSPVAQKA